MSQVEDREDLGYFTPHIDVASDEDERTSEDEINYSTLKDVCKTLKYNISKLDKVSFTELPKDKYQRDVRIDAIYLALEILEPIYQQVVNSIDNVDLKRKG